jgi:hypothetical protein
MVVGGFWLLNCILTLAVMEAADTAGVILQSSHSCAKVQLQCEL